MAIDELFRQEVTILERKTTSKCIDNLLIIMKGSNDFN